MASRSATRRAISPRPLIRLVGSPITIAPTRLRVTLVGLSHRAPRGGDIAWMRRGSPNLDVLREPQLTQSRSGRLDLRLGRRRIARGNLETDVQLQARGRDERRQDLRVKVHPLLGWYRTLP